MIVLGVSGALSHDASAALFVDGKCVAAVEEERLIRDKHAKNCMAHHAVKFCLKSAGIQPDKVDVVAYPFAPVSLNGPARWHYAKRYWYAPDRALDVLFNGNRRYRRYVRSICKMLSELGFSIDGLRMFPVEHHLAHASSAYHLSGFQEKTAILSLDGKGEYATTLFAYGEAGKIHKIKEFYDPDSLGGLYGAITEYLGFDMLDGEYKVMGMAPYGNPYRFDFSRLARFEDGELHVNTRLVNTVGMRRYKDNGQGFYFSPLLLDWLGPRRRGDDIDDPYVDYAASMQRLFEDLSLAMIDYYLADILKESGKIAFAGGCALNVKLNQKIIQRPDVKELFVQPAATDAGTALGAASYAAVELKERVSKMSHVYLGPQYTTEQCVAACRGHGDKPSYTIVDDPSKTGAEILAAGHPLAWFQGRMEFGPRALGNRSILGSPSSEGIADRINTQIKYRERWRPFCPSILDTVAADLLGSEHPAPYMTFAFRVAEHWKNKIPEVVHQDGSIRAQVVSKETNPRYYALIESLYQLQGMPVVLNTSLNRRGEPMVCSPADALNMFFGSDLQFLMMENVLVTKQPWPAKNSV